MSESCSLKGINEARAETYRIETRLVPAFGHSSDILLETEDLSDGQAWIKVQNQIHHLIDSGRKISAIKLLREWTGWGLKDAKLAIDLACSTADFFGRGEPDG